MGSENQRLGTRVGIRFDRELLADLRKLAKDEDRDLSYFIRRELRRVVKNSQKSRGKAA